MIRRAPFIVLEGGEGAGKTSVLAALGKALRAAGHNVLETREPGGTEEGLALRALLLSDHAPHWDPAAELLLMTAARVQHVKRLIAPALAAGTTVLCDRFLGSTLAYQGAGRGINRGLIEDLHDRLVGLRPDLTILLDVDPATGLARSKQRLAATAVDEERFEALSLAFHERVRAEFLRQSSLSLLGYAVLDAGRAIGDVQSDAIAAVEAFLEGAPDAHRRHDDPHGSE